MSLSRQLQYIFIALITITVGFSLYQWSQSRAAQTVTDNRPTFEAPLTTTIDLARGVGVATYSRADGADRRATVTDFEGLIRPVKNGEARFEGARRVENLLSYSENLSNAAWANYVAGFTKTSGFSDPDGGLNAWKLDNNSTANSGITRSGGTAGAMYTMSVWLKADSGTPSIRIGLGDSSDVSKTISTTWSRYSYTGTMDVYNRIFKVVSPPSATVIYMYHPQVEDVTGEANQNPSEYVSTNVKTAVPYHGANVDGVKYFATQNGNTVASNVVTEATGTAIPDATLRGYLAEGARTNLLIHSEIDSWWYTVGTTTLTNNAVVAPSGQMTAASVLASDTSSGIHAVHGGGDTTVSPSTAYTVSAYIKAAGENFAYIQVNNQVSSVAAVAYFDLITGATATADLIAGFTNKSATATAVGNGWWRVTFTLTTDASSTALGTYIGPTGSISSRTYIGVIGNGIDLWGTQLEQAAFVSSYIPTTTASVARAIDVLSYPMPGNFNDTTGSVALEFTPRWTGTTGSSDAVFLASSNGGASPQRKLSLWEWGGSTNFLVADRSAGDTATRNNPSTTAVSLVSGTPVRIATKYDASAVKFFGNGSLLSTDSTLTLPYDSINGGSVCIGNGLGTCSNSTYAAFSAIKNVRAWKKALSDTELNNLTSLTQSISTSAVKQSTVKAPNTTGLVGYWHFDDGSGTKAGDTSGNNSTGTLTNGPTWVDGKFGKALSFTAASSQYVSLGNVSSLKNSVFTYSAWVNPVSFTGPKTIIGGGVASTPRIRVDDVTGQIDIINTNINLIGTSTGAVAAGAWSHVAVTYDASGNYVFYINGVASGSGMNLQTFSFTSASFEIGRNGYSNSEYFDGQIDDVRMYSRVLSRTEIAQLYQTKVGKINASQNDRLTSGLVGLWSFNGPDVSGVTAYDRSGSGNNGTLTNSPVITEGKVGQALSFDGIDDYVTMGDPGSGNLDMGTNNFSLSIWVKSTDTTNTKGLISKGQNNFTSAGFDLLKRHGAPYNGLYLRLSDGSANTAGQVTPSSDLTSTLWDGDWHYAVVTIDRAGSGVIYVDGTSRGSANISSLTGSISNATTFLVGAGRQDTSTITYQSSGSIDEVRIYNRALSTTEISALYNSGR